MRRALFLALVGGCGYAEETLAVPDPDAAVFRAEVYPVLLARCGFPACHGSDQRFFAIYGPGRTRLDPATAPYAPATTAEVALTFARSRSMLIGPDGPARAPLVRKPLAVAAGGAGHRGDDPWGASVFASSDDPDFQVLVAWADAAEVAP